MRSIISINVFCLVFITTAIPMSSAYSFDVDHLPNGAVFSCDNCHLPSGTEFINDYEASGRTWSATLAAKDSDNDGFTNGQELLDPYGEWEEGEVDPGNASDVTNPGDPSSHSTEPTSTPPVNTPTPAQSTPTPQQSTPTPDSTHPGEDTPTPAPSACDHTHVSICMPATYFTPGDICGCHAVICNAEGSPLENHPLVVILAIDDILYYAPSFSTSFDSYIQRHPIINEGVTTVTIIDDFTWPDVTDPLSGVMWYAALTNPGVTALVGDYGYYEFGWGN